ncbi:MAG: hypothetical protein A2020_01035 [Lentisphaerae bacterium GWF2_45_14]|nr:MAG: hypothetical protein A2020_01035 [Lentisphaerae bacterium GWF2_45_14]
MEELVVSSSPHVHDNQTVRKIMLTVLLALVPSCLCGIYFYGINALMVIIYCVVFSVAVEVLWCRIAGKKTDTWKDCSAILTGVLLAMNLSAGIPWWVCLIGAGIGIGIGKQIYGGLGYNPFNPALVARVALLVAFPKLMTTWVPSRFMTENPVYDKIITYAPSAEQLKGKVIPFLSNTCDSITCATPLGVVKELSKSGVHNVSAFDAVSNTPMYWDYFFGNMGGCLGETSVLALLAGGIFLIAMKIIKWHIPVTYIATVAIFSAAIHAANPAITPGPLFHVITGGLFLGAFFMATDMVTSPITKKGMIIFGIGCGIITSLIRIWGNYPEGVSFSILLMNAVVPLIDKFTVTVPFGYKAAEKKVGA